MKRLLILAYDFPPYVSVGGLRPYAWYKYLNEFGVYPIVVTRLWGNKYGNELDYVAPSESAETIVEETEFGTIIRTPYKSNLANRLMLKYGNRKFVLLRKAITAWYEFMQFLFFVGPKSGLYRGARAYLKSNKVDAIIATGEPFILFKYASALSGKYGIPWIADYRDPWVQNKNRSRFMGSWNSFFEKKYLANASCATTVDEFFKSQIGNSVIKPFHLIPNGYTPDAIEAVSNIPQSGDKLRFAFVGTIYQWHPIESVLNEFASFAESDYAPDFELNFYGINRPTELEKMLTDKYPTLLRFVTIVPRMKNDLLLEALARHNVLLLFNYYYFTGTKIYDYIGLKRKILFCYSDDPDAFELKKKYYPYSFIEENQPNDHIQEDCLTETKSGIIVRDKNHLKQVLRELYNEFEKNRYIACNSINTERYSRKHGAELLAKVVGSIA
ncbi:MAG: hypothetical protein J6U13_03745 [Salinivirgaceae bacterium]|nr:hypothetical protein [Salinivirgaceae bacterium]